MVAAFQVPAQPPSTEAKARQRLAKIVAQLIDRAYEPKVRAIVSISIPSPDPPIRILRGRFLGRGGKLCSFTVDLERNSLSFKLIRNPSRRRRDSLPWREDAAKCKVGLRCKGTCISKQKTCLNDLNLGDRAIGQIQDIAAAAAGKTPPPSETKPGKYEGKTIRELQKIARDRGVYRSNHYRKAELATILEQMDRDPRRAKEISRRGQQTAKRRRGTILSVSTAIAEFAPRGVYGTYNKLRRALRQMKAGNLEAAAILTTSSLLAAKAIASRQIRERYKKGLEESAKLALERADKIPVDRVGKPNILFAVGGLVGSTGEAIKDALEAPQDRSKGERWFSRANHILPFNNPDYRATPDFNKKVGGIHTPAHIASTLQQGAKRYLDNLRYAGRNPAAVDLAARMYAYGAKYPSKAMNILAHREGGNIADEAVEILSRMKGSKRQGGAGKAMLDRLNLVRMGSNYFGMANDRNWSNGKISHRTLTGKRDPFGFLPKRAADVLSSVRGGEIPDYLGNRTARDRIREAFGFYKSSRAGGERARKRGTETRAAVGEAIKLVSPGAAKVWKQADKLVDMAYDNPTGAKLTAGALVAAGSYGAYRKAVSNYQKDLPNAAADAVDLVRNGSEPPYKTANNITMVVGGEGASSEELIDELPDEIKKQNGRTGQYTRLVDGADYGLGGTPSAESRRNLKESAVAEQSEGATDEEVKAASSKLPDSAYSAMLAVKAYGRGLQKNLGTLIPSPTGKRKHYSQDAVKLAAEMYKLGRQKAVKGKSNYQLTVIAARDGGQTARAAMEILAQMPSVETATADGRTVSVSGKKVAAQVKLATLGTPAFGATNESRGRGKYVPDEENFQGDRDPTRFLPRRGKQTNAPGAGTPQETLRNPEVRRRMQSKDFWGADTRNPQKRKKKGAATAKKQRAKGIREEIKDRFSGWDLSNLPSELQGLDPNNPAAQQKLLNYLEAQERDRNKGAAKKFAEGL